MQQITSACSWERVGSTETVVSSWSFVAGSRFAVGYSFFANRTTCPADEPAIRLAATGHEQKTLVINEAAEWLRLAGAEQRRTNNHDLVGDFRSLGRLTMFSFYLYTQV